LEGEVSADLTRFLATDPKVHAQALAEIRAGEKRSHWMWFVFPQLRILGRSEMARHYGIADADEAEAFLRDPLLGPRLGQITTALLAHAGRKDAVQILGPIDAQKLCSCMTLFAFLPGADPFFEATLGAFCSTPCAVTLAALSERGSDRN
jgi:uncharacterized protein (DUF1810 family)